jgi:hypothetical protein
MSARISKTLGNLTRTTGFLLAAATTVVVGERHGARAERNAQPPVRMQLQALAPSTVDADGIAIGWPRSFPRERGSVWPQSLAVLVAAWLRSRALDLLTMAGLAGVVGTVHAWGMGRSPAFFDDEGTYVSQAWAVDKAHVLAPYTYWYDHPPLGWVLLAGWAKLQATFGPTEYAVAAARSFILAVLVASACLLYLVARRLGLRRAFAAAAVLLFTLSPLALHYQRMVLLDNIAVGWLLAAFVLALTPKRRLWSYAGSGLCFACAGLTKETFLLFLPALLLAVWHGSEGRTRRFALGTFMSLFVLVAGFFPLFAVLRGELLEGAHHTSLMYGIRFQLTRQGGGSLLDAHSAVRSLVDNWLTIDPVVLAAGVALLPLGFLVRRFRSLALALAIPVAAALRPGGYVPAMYVIGILPFAALMIAAGADWLWRPVAIVTRVPAAGPRRSTRLRGLALASSLAAIALVSGLAANAAPRWAAADQKQMRADEAAPSRKAVDWLAAHVDHDDRLLVDDTIWTDLVDRGFKRERTIWFYKLDLDPAIRVRWSKIDYVVRSNLMDFMARNLSLRRTRRALENSRLVVVFANADDRIEIRRVIKPRSDRLVFALRRGCDANGAATRAGCSTG